jgi:hypothetical protein
MGSILLCFCGSLYPHVVEGKYWANLTATFLVGIALVLAQFEKSAKQTTDVDFSDILMRETGGNLVTWC